MTSKKCLNAVVELPGENVNDGSSTAFPLYQVVWCSRSIFPDVVVSKSVKPVSTRHFITSYPPTVEKSEERRARPWNSAGEFLYADRRPSAAVNPHKFGINSLGYSLKGRHFERLDDVGHHLFESIVDYFAPSLGVPFGFLTESNVPKILSPTRPK